MTKAELLSGTRQISPPRDPADVSPLAVTVARACELSGFGQTSIWAFIKDGRLAAVRLPGVRRTLVPYESLRRLLALPCLPNWSRHRLSAAVGARARLMR